MKLHGGIVADSWGSSTIWKNSEVWSFPKGLFYKYAACHLSERWQISCRVKSCDYLSTLGDRTAYRWPPVDLPRVISDNLNIRAKRQRFALEKFLRLSIFPQFCNPLRPYCGSPVIAAQPVLHAPVGWWVMWLRSQQVASLFLAVEEVTVHSPITAESQTVDPLPCLLGLILQSLKPPRLADGQQWHHTSAHAER